MGQIFLAHPLEEVVEHWPTRTISQSIPAVAIQLSLEPEGATTQTEETAALILRQQGRVGVRLGHAEALAGLF